MLGGRESSFTNLARYRWLCVCVPGHQELDRGTLRAITRQIGLSVDEFVDLL